MGAIDLVDPDRGAAVGRERDAAHRPGRPHDRRGQPRRDRPEVPRRPRRLRRRDARDARGAHRVDPLSAQPARRARAADRRDGRRWTRGRSRSSSIALRQAAPFAELGRGAFEGVLDMLSGRYPSDDFADLRPRLTWDRLAGTADRARGRQARRGDQRRHDSGSRAVRRVPDRRARTGRARRRARRRDGLREPGRRDVPARRVELAHRGDHPRSRAGLARTGRAGQDAVLEGGLRPAGRWSSAGTSARWSARLRHLPPRRARSSGCAASRSRSAGGGKPGALPRRSGRRGRRRARRSHDPGRALPRRARRLADLRAHAVRRADPCARGRWPSSSAPAPRPASTSRRCGPTTGSWCGFRRRTSRRTRR